MEHAELKRCVEATGCAQAVGETVFLHDPAGGPAERERLRAWQAQADLRPAGAARGWLCLPTGGTSGGPKLVRHDEQTLTAAVEGVARHFGLARINAVDVLPPYHVSGLMARVRAAATGGTHVAWNWKRLEAGEPPPLPERDDGWVLSLVPTQLQRLLAQPGALAWLRQLRVIFVGGGPLWPEVAEAAARERLPLAPGYGLTETAAMVAALRPEEFLAGRRDSGTALPHARLALGADGVIQVGGASLFRGYWPGWRTDDVLVTEDRGELDADGRLRVLGRRDDVIITGGKKVAPAEVEAVLRVQAGWGEVAVVGVPHGEWGEVVVACVPAGAGRDAARTAAALGALAPHQRPKHVLEIDPWPRNDLGKLNRAGLRTAAQARLEGGR